MKNLKWIKYLYETISSSELNLQIDGSHIMDGDISIIANNLFSNFNSIVVEETCESCGNIEIDNIPVATAFLESNNLQNLVTQTVDRILSEIKKCKKCQINLTKKFEFGNLIIIVTLQRVHNGTINQHHGQFDDHTSFDSTLEKVPTKLNFNDDEYDLKFLINFDHVEFGVGHYTCYLPMAKIFIRIDDLPTHNKTIKVDLKQRINPCLIVYSKLNRNKKNQIMVRIPIENIDISLLKQLKRKISVDEIDVQPHPKIQKKIQIEQNIPCIMFPNSLTLKIKG